MELSENALRAEIQKLGVAPIDGTAPLSSCVEQLLSAFEGMRSQVAELSDQVYTRLEKRLGNERMRRGR